MKGKKRLLIIIFSLFLTVIGGSFAWFSYATRQSALVLTIGDLTDTRMIITPYHINETILPVNTYTSGVYNNVEIINNRSNPTSIILYYRINQLDQTLIDNGLKYTITKSSSKDGTYTEVVTDDFADISNNQLVILDTKVSASATTYYKVYVWLDSSVGNQSELQNMTLDIELNGTIIQMPEEPVIQDGMIPVTIANNGTVTTVLETDPDWYDYNKQEWANMILVNDSSRSKYLNTENVTVTASDILAYYVWVPRYKYRIPNVACSSIPESERDIMTNPECYTGPYTMSEEDKTKLMEFWVDNEYCDAVDDYLDEATNEINNALETGYLSNGVSIVSLVKNYNNYESGEMACYMEMDGIDITLTGTFSGDSSITTARTIDISFESFAAKMLVGDAVNNYRSHPAFWWDNDNDGIVDSDEKLAGIWVGKFEITPDKSSTCYSSPSLANCNNTTQNPTILPNEASLTYQYIGRQLTTSQNISKGKNIYGLSSAVTDAHMAKNSEWGAVAYLSHSNYGINGEVRINNYWNSTNNKYTLTGCGAASDNAGSSTTCSIVYGSGVSEYPQSTTGNISGVFDMSGGAWEHVMGNYGNKTNSTYIPILPDSKYYDLYSSTQFTGNNVTNMSLCTLETCGGHALNETANWYGDFTNFANTYGVWFVRGGVAYSGSGAGVFSSTYGGGYGYSNSWRSIIVAAKDLVPPTCELIATNDGVEFGTYSDDVVSIGMSTSSTVTYNGTELLPLDYGTYYGYVKDAAGNTGSCSTTVTTTKEYTNYDYIGCDEETMSDYAGACGSYGEDYVSNTCSVNNYYEKYTYYCTVEDYLITCEDGTQLWFTPEEWREVNSSTDGPMYVCMEAGMPIDYTVSGGDSYWMDGDYDYVTLANCTSQTQPTCDEYSAGTSYSTCNSSYIADTSYSGSITCSYSYMDCEDGYYVNDSYCYTTN